MKKAEKYQITVGLSLLLFLNTLIYHLLYWMRSCINVKVENKILKQQNEFFRFSHEEFEKQWFLLSKMRHDLKNNCALQMDYLEKGRYDLLMSYYREQIGEIGNREEVIHTGNIGIDSIVNYKLSTARKMQVTVEKTIRISGRVGISNIDLNILIGNLMDNAIEAAGNMDAEKRKIRLAIKNDETAFFMEINNFFKGERIKDSQGEFLTGKRNKACHGIGLKAVKEIVRKYDGQMIIDSKKGEFCIKVLIYMDS